MKRFLLSSSNNLVVAVLSLALGVSLSAHWFRGDTSHAQEGRRRVLTAEQKAVLTALQDAFSTIAEAAEPSVVTVTASATRQESEERPGPADRPRLRQPAPDEPPARPRPNRPRFFGEGQDPSVPFDLREFFREQGPQRRGPSVGSGVIIRESGGTVYVLTNHHVVRDRDRFRVQLIDGHEYAGELVGADQKSDLAVLKFRPAGRLPAGSIAVLGDSDRVRVGEWVMAIGSPLGYESTLTVGVVSAKGRELGQPGSPSGTYTDLIQTAASNNRGNSGGPLINIDGEVIGVNVAIAPGPMGMGNIGIGFAIPSNIAKMVSNQLIDRGKVIRGYLGVGTWPTHRDLAPELREYLKVNSGALVETVGPDTPAAKAGVRPGDVVVRFGSKPVRSFTELENAVAEVAPNSSHDLEVIRDGQPVKLRITVTERPAENDPRLRSRAGGDDTPPPSTGGVKSKFGLTIRPIDGGVQVITVAPDSTIGDQVFPGDVITHVGKTAVDSIDEYQKSVERQRGDEACILTLRAPNGLRYCIVRP